VEQNSKISTTWIARYELQKSFFWPYKNPGMFTSQAHIFNEKVPKIVVLLFIHSSRQVGYILENFQIIWNCTIYREKIVSKKK